MSGGAKLAVGAVVVGGAGAAYLLWRQRQKQATAKLSLTVPAPVGITSIYSTQGTQALPPVTSTMSARTPFFPAPNAPSPAPLPAGMAPLAAFTPAAVAGQRAQASFLDASPQPAIATILNMPLPTFPPVPTVPSVTVAPATGPMVESRRGKAHF